MSRAHPMVTPACALVGGIVLAAWLGPWPAWPLLGAAAPPLGLLLWRGLRGHGLSPWLLALACLLLGAGLLCLQRNASLPPDHLVRWADGRGHQLTALARLGPGDLSPPRAWLLAARQRLAWELNALPPNQGRALVLGQRGGLHAATREAFGATGAAHLLAISGLHIGLVWGLAYLLLRWGLAAWPGLALRWPVLKLAAAGALLPGRATPPWPAAPPPPCGP